MKHNSTGTQRKTRLAQAFERLTPQNQTYVDTLTARLSKIHETAPEAQTTSRIMPKNRVQSTREQEKP